MTRTAALFAGVVARPANSTSPWPLGTPWARPGTGCGTAATTA
ncbi:hypothetical protein NKH18_00060 [Streptomyces sp. M10(2022)]